MLKLSLTFDQKVNENVGFSLTLKTKKNDMIMRLLVGVRVLFGVRVLAVGMRVPVVIRMQLECGCQL